MNDNLLPEEKLLELIRKDNFSGQVPQRRQGIVMRLTANIGRKFIVLLARAGTGRLMSLFLFISFVVFFASFFYSPFTKAKRITSSADMAIELPAVAEENAEKPLEYYLEQIRNNSVFYMSKAAKKQSSQFFGAIKDIVLLGIIADEPPQAIIKDKNNKNTYYLSEGDSLGELVLLEILEGKVIIEYGGEKYEVHL